MARNRVGIALGLVRISDGQLPQQGAKVTAPGGGILEGQPSGRMGEGDGRGRVSRGLDFHRPNMALGRDAGRAELVGRNPQVCGLTAGLTRERDEVLSPVPRLSKC